MTYLGADFICDFLERLPDSFNRAGGLEDESAGCLLVLELGLGTPVDVTDDFVDGLLQLRASGDLVGSERDALRVLAGDVHGRKGGATANGHRGRRAIAGSGAIDAVGGNRGGLLAPGGRDSSLGARLDGAEGWEGLLRRRVQRRLLGGSRSGIGLLLASSLVAQSSRAIVGRLGRGRRMSDILLVDHVFDGDMVVGVFLHELLRWGQALGGRAGDCFRCHS